MLKLYSSLSQIITVNTQGENLKRGSQLKEIGILENHSIVTENDIIKDFIPHGSEKKEIFDHVIDLPGKVILPGLIDCHTHTIFAGSRANEFRMKIAGASYEEIAQMGGGINRTVQSLRELSLQELVELTKPKIEYAISQGITTLEIKSGYGLNLEDEIKILEVIEILNKQYEIDIVSTFLGAHTYPPEFKTDHESYIKLITERLLPYIAQRKLARFCDAFCEKTAFSVDETEVIFKKASELGFDLKLHTDQFNNIGGIDLGLKYNVQSLDHLEVINKKEIKKVSKAETACVLLPGVSFFLHYGYAPAREMINGGAILAISTDYNPGSSHIANLNFIMSLACIELRMTFEEVISAVTINAAKALGENLTRGSLEIGKKADFAVFDTEEYSDIIYNVAKNLNICTVKNGKVIYKSSKVEI
ncbi:MAG: imidazolonepropionase [Bacteroidota bacterium]|nr:imidazolonepropionase [Bacteroidota bacterium]